MDKSIGIIGVVIGVSLILFRKGFARLVFDKQLEENPTQKARKYREQLRQMNAEGLVCKVVEVATAVVGAMFILLGIARLLPQTKKAIMFFLAMFGIALFAGGAAAIVELTLMFRWLWRNVRKYVVENCANSLMTPNDSSRAGSLGHVPALPSDDPVLRALERKAITYSVLCFIPLFTVFFLAFYTIIRVTS